MRAIVLMLTLLYPYLLWGQEVNQQDAANSDNEQDLYLEEMAQEEEVPTDASDTTSTSASAKNSKTQTDNIRVECVCPDNELEREVSEENLGSESYMPSIFAPGTAVTIMPTPENDTPTKVEIQTKEYPPAYIEKLPSGYSNDSYKPIGTYEEIKP